MLSWNDSLHSIPDLNLAQKRALTKYGAKTVGDLLRIIPRRYDDYTHAVPVGRAPIGRPVTMRVKVDEIKRDNGFHRRITIIKAKVSDASGQLNIIWFNQPWLLEEIKAGTDIFVSGTINFRPRFGKQMANPIWEHVADALISGRVAPVYPLTGSVAQKTMRELVAVVADQLGEIDDPLPSSIREHEQLPTLVDAYRAIHRPHTVDEAEQGRLRIAFDEFFIYRLALGSARAEANEAGSPPIPFDEPFAKSFVAALPFTLTDDQKRAAWVALQDMEKNVPMRRLLQGDVGSGKTAVAAFLMAMASRSNQSAVLMAPTELLAKQHATSVRRYVSAREPVAFMLLTSSEKRLWEGGEEKKLTGAEARERILQGRIAIVGTHALLERDMMPPDTALAVVDEQHRFGVAQREAMTVAHRPDGLSPHLLSMTATPIPRSLALTLYGDLDVSIIRTKPAGRRLIKTYVRTGIEREEAYDAIRTEVSKGHRVFIVCPLIDESDTLGVASATAEAKRLASGPLKGLRIGLLHGRMKAADKDGVMGEFVEGLIDVLVSTTVVEVGVDVPEATVMAIEGAERFGLAQLHQLRGRVGRSDLPSMCYLLSDAENESLDRLRILEKTNDGFVIAEEDLKRRGEGNVLGFEQAGASVFVCARPTDVTMMTRAKESAETILREDQDLARHFELRERVEKVRRTSHQE
ncbi:MAG: ATP-dependent DNA helicase RecG [Patescibacteria group bacterium]